MIRSILFFLIFLIVPSLQAGTPQVGDLVPNIKIKDVNGSDVPFHNILGDAPKVVIFYRGGWCPYCNFHLKDLKSIEPKLLSMGVKIIAISPDKPSELNKSITKHKLNYKLYSDAKMQLAKAMGIFFVVDSGTLTKYKKFGIDLESASGETHHQLPIPSVFLISQKKIMFAHSDPDYKVRLPAKKILDLASKSLKKK